MVQAYLRKVRELSKHDIRDIKRLRRGIINLSHPEDCVFIVREDKPVGATLMKSEAKMAIAYVSDLHPDDGTNSMASMATLLDGAKLAKVPTGYKYVYSMHGDDTLLIKGFASSKIGWRMHEEYTEKERIKRWMSLGGKITGTFRLLSLCAADEEARVTKVVSMQFDHKE